MTWLHVMYIIQKQASVRENLASDVLEMAESHMQSAHSSLRVEGGGKDIPHRKTWALTCMGGKARLSNPDPMRDGILGAANAECLQV